MKNMLLTCLVIMFSYGVSAQTWEDLNKQVKELYKNKEFEKALPIAIQTIDTVKKELGENNDTSIKVINTVGLIYFKLKQLEKAEPFFIKAAEITKTIYGDTHSEYAKSLVVIASLYTNMQQPTKALQLYIRATEIWRNVPDYPNYLNGLKKLVDFYEAAKEYDKAEPLYFQLQETQKKIKGEITEDYATSLNYTAAFYTKIGEYAKAENFYNRAKEIYKEVYGENHEVYASNLNSLALLYEKMALYEKAELIFKAVSEIDKNISGEISENYVSDIGNLAVLYREMGQYKKAEAVYLKAEEISKKLYGENDENYASSLENLGVIYKDLGQYEKANSFLLQAKDIIEKALGEKDIANVAPLNDLAALYQQMGLYKKAETLYNQAKDIRKEILGEADPTYVESLNKLALLYEKMGLYEKSESLYFKSIEIRKKVPGEKDPEYAQSLYNLAVLYSQMGQFENAEQLFLQAKDILEIAPGENLKYYVLTLNSLATSYRAMGKYEEAEPLYLQAIEIRRKILGENHPDYAESLNSIAALYTYLGQYEKAEQLFLQVKKIRKEVFGESHAKYAEVLNNLSTLYMDMGQYEKAEPLLLQAMEIDKILFGENHKDYASDLSNLALFYSHINQFEKAEALNLQAIDIRKKILGEHHFDYAISLNNLAEIYRQTGKYEKAVLLYTQAKNIWKNILGENHPTYSECLNNLASIYIAMGQYENAEPLLLHHSRIIIQNMLNNFSILSEKEKANYLERNISVNEMNNSYLYNYKIVSLKITQNNFNLQLLFKSLTLSETRSVMNAVQHSSDTSVKRILQNWQINKSILAKQYALPITERRADMIDIEAQTEKLENELSRKSALFNNQRKATRISSLDIQKNLQRDEVAIEFVKFNLYNKKWTDSIIYAAYILRKNDSVPVFVPLCEEKQLGKYFSSTSGSSNIKTIYRSDPIDEDNKPSISGDSLYALVWKPLLPYLTGIKKINYSPAGLLYKVAFQALPTGDSSLLMDKYELNQFTSTRQLALIGENRLKDNSIALFGNAIFSMDSITVVKNIPASNSVNTLISATVERSDTKGGWKQLEGTANEIASIKTLFDENKITSRSYVQESATEEQFKSLSGNSPTMLHLATHGFFLPDPVKKKQEGFAADNRNAFTLADDPLLRSGIVLSAANRVWGGEPPIAGREDGIVTAYEIAQMDLSKTDLVVLSACETALGDIKGNEGVFGLQRAFKLAGVKNMVLSLWKVPDAETAELMKIFYTYYLQGKTARGSLAAAQKEMRKKYAPFYWAAFVLIE